MTNIGRNKCTDGKSPTSTLDGPQKLQKSIWDGFLVSDLNEISRGLDKFALLRLAPIFEAGNYLNRPPREGDVFDRSSSALLKQPTAWNLFSNSITRNGPFAIGGALREEPNLCIKWGCRPRKTKTLSQNTRTPCPSVPEWSIVDSAREK